MRQKRQAAGALSGFLLSLGAAAVLVAVATIDLFALKQIPADKPLPLTVRIPTIGIFQDDMTKGATFRVERLRQPRGKVLDPRKARMLRAYEQKRRPPSAALMIGLVVAAGLLFMLYVSYLRVHGGEVALLRTQLTLLGCVTLLAIGGKVLLVLSDWSSLWIPLVAIILPVALHLGPRVGGATSVAAAIALSLLTPIDLPLLVALISQGLAVSATTRLDSRFRQLVGGTVAAACAGLIGYSALCLLLDLRLDVGIVSGATWGWNQALRSDLVASVCGPIGGALLAVVLSPAIQRGLGQVSRGRLSRLADFEHPLLRRLASRAPGTWAHSLSMANLAEMAANAIHANGLLVRVGAYFHDVGKSAQPEYFIENQDGSNPHDELDPEVSADAIFAHVVEGVRLARRHNIPETVIEFIYTHHGTERLEYFWHKQVKATGRKVPDASFRYPGIAPQTRETGILAICDSVEAASKSLTEPDAEDVKQLVRQIVVTKLEHGLLDQCGLTVADLRKIAETLTETLRSSMHVRVKYPWQEEQDKEKGKGTAKETAPAAAEQQAPPEQPASTPKPAASSRPPKSSKPIVVGERPAVPVEAPAVEEPPAADEPAWVSELQAKPARQRMQTRPLGARPEDPSKDS